MKVKILFGALTIFAFLTTGCTSPKEELSKAGKRSMTAQELTALYAQDPIFAFTTSQGGEAVMKQYANGRVELDVNNGGYKDEGTYRLKGNQTCFVWKKIRNGKEGCSSLYDLGDNKFRSINEDGSESSTNLRRTK